jgi:Flp pilus assembly pilin Flp
VLVVALTGAGPLEAGALVALLATLGAPVLVAGVLADAGALAGAVGGCWSARSRRSA